MRDDGLIQASRRPYVYGRGVAVSNNGLVGHGLIQRPTLYIRRCLRVNKMSNNSMAHKT